MKTVLTTAFALAVAAAPLSAATLHVDPHTLTLAQQVQLWAVMNSDDNTATRQLKIETILNGSNATPQEVTANKIRFIRDSDLNTVAAERMIEAARG